MLKKSLFISTLIASLLFAFSAAAQTAAPPPPASSGTAAPGTNAPAEVSAFRAFGEVSLGYGMCMGDGCDYIDGSVGIHVAGFVKLLPNLWVGGNITYQALSPEGDASFSSLAVSGEGRFFIPVAPKIKAYALGGLGYASATMEVDTGYGTIEVDDSAIFAKLGGGVDYMIAPNMSVGAQAYYQLNFWSEEDDEGDTASLDYLYIGLKFGLYF